MLDIEHIFQIIKKCHLSKYLAERNKGRFYNHWGALICYWCLNIGFDITTNFKSGLEE
jgi:hypothetical protein